MVGCGLTSATWLPLTMRLPPSTRPSGSRERRSFAFIRENSGIAYRPRRIFSITSRIVLEHRRCLRGDGSTRPPTFLRLWLPSVSRRGHGGTRSRRRATKRRRCVDYAGRPLWVYALSDDHDRGAFIREASGLRLVRPFSKPFWTFAGHSRGTESRNQEDLGGPGRTRSRQQSNTSGHLRSREDTGGHVTNTVRDREAPGSNPGPPTNQLNSNFPDRARTWPEFGWPHGFQPCAIDLDRVPKGGPM